MGCVEDNIKDQKEKEHSIVDEKYMQGLEIPLRMIQSDPGEYKRSSPQGIKYNPKEWQISLFGFTPEQWKITNNFDDFIDRFFSLV